MEHLSILIDRLAKRFDIDLMDLGHHAVVSEKDSLAMVGKDRQDVLKTNDFTGAKLPHILFLLGGLLLALRLLQLCQLV